MRRTDQDFAPYLPGQQKANGEKEQNLNQYLKLPFQNLRFVLALELGRFRLRGFSILKKIQILTHDSKQKA